VSPSVIVSPPLRVIAIDYVHSPRIFFRKDKISPDEPCRPQGGRACLSCQECWHNVSCPIHTLTASDSEIQDPARIAEAVRVGATRSRPWGWANHRRDKSRKAVPGGERPSGIPVLNRFRCGLRRRLVRRSIPYRCVFCWYRKGACFPGWVVWWTGFRVAVRRGETRLCAVEQRQGIAFCSGKVAPLGR